MAKTRVKGYSYIRDGHRVKVKGHLRKTARNPRRTRKSRR